ncbi:hypothetical protein V8F20_008982 [Naviculisporaceae sp. PSN 640]
MLSLLVRRCLLKRLVLCWELDGRWLMLWMRDLVLLRRWCWLISVMWLLLRWLLGRRRLILQRLLWDMRLLNRCLPWSRLVSVLLRRRSWLLISVLLLLRISVLLLRR